MILYSTFHCSKLFQSSLAIIWVQESLTCSSVCLFIDLFLCYDPWVDKIICSLGYRLRSRVALGVGIVIIMYIVNFLMEYTKIRKFEKMVE